MTATTKKASTLSESISTVLERVTTLKDENKSRAEIMVELNRMIHDPALFSQKQRAVVVRDLNKEFDFNFTLNEIKKAHRTVNTAKPEKAVPVDGLSGKATLTLETKPGQEEPAKAPDDTASAVAPASKPDLGGTFTLSNNGNEQTLQTSSSTQDTETMGIKDTFAKVSNTINEVNLDHAGAVSAVKANLSTNYGVHNNTDLARALDGFFAAHPDLYPQFQAFEKLHPESTAGNFDALVDLFEADSTNNKKFYDYLINRTATPKVEFTATAPKPAPEATVEAVAPAAGPGAEQPAVSVAAAASVDKSVLERLKNGVRGNRESGFSSGVVAAAAAVIGGGLEMAFKGDVTLGSALGTAAGATGAYFLGNASEKLMDTETGRYMLAGAIGVVAGGLGSRVGRTLQAEFTKPTTDLDTAIETATGLPAPQAVPVVNSTEALSAMLGL